MNDCKHRNFRSDVAVNRIIEGDSIVFNADIRIKCVDCGLPFEFTGIPWGVDVRSPHVSIDKMEARLPISPTDHSQSLFHPRLEYAIIDSSKIKTDKQD